MVLRPFPRKVATFSNDFIFTTLTTTEVHRSARDPFYHPETQKQCTLWTLDGEMVYQSFAEDFGPLNICYVFEALIAIQQKLHPKGGLTRPLCLFTSVDPGKKATMALIACLYFLFVKHWSPHEAFECIAEFELVPFRDAGNGPNDHALSVQDCLYGLDKALSVDLLEMNLFDPEWYRYHEQVRNGDMNKLGPFIPFASPIEMSWCKAAKAAHIELEAGGNPSWPPPQTKIASHAFRTVLKAFEEESVGLVIRLNDELYDKRHFTDRGMQHEEMYFDDGSNPSDMIVRQFIAMCEHVIEVDKMKVAVHCKAGLGRTGVLIGAYFIYKYRFSAQEVIAYMRMIRPGMVVGPQQRYMMKNQMKWVEWSVIDNLAKMKIDDMEVDSVNPLATPPAEIDMPLPLSSPLTVTPRQRIVLEDLTEKLQSKTSSNSLSSRSQTTGPNAPLIPKGGDAVGQPRKSMSGRHQSVTAPIDVETVEVLIRPASPVQQSVLPVRASSIPRALQVDPAQNSSTRGVKRGAGRSPLPRQMIPERVSFSATTRLAVPPSNLHRSSSATSVASSSASGIGGPARKRPAYDNASSPHGRTGLSSPPISRETTPANDVAATPSRIPSMTRVANKLRRKVTPGTETHSTPPPSAALTSPPSAYTEPKRSLLPIRGTVLPKDKTFPQALPSLDETAEKASRRRGLTPPRWGGRFGNPQS